MTPLSLLSNKNNHISLKSKESGTNQTHIWHLCLDHINLNMIQRPIKYGILHSLILEDLSLWESYIEDKMTKKPFTFTQIRANESLQQSTLLRIKFIATF